MKNWNLKRIIGFGLGMSTGFIIYDYFFKESIEWPKALFAGAFGIGLLFILKNILPNKE